MCWMSHWLRLSVREMRSTPFGQKFAAAARGGSRPSEMRLTHFVARADSRKMRLTPSSLFRWGETPWPLGSEGLLGRRPLAPQCIE